MILKINCEFNYLGTWCKCKQIKRKWYEIGGKGCIEYSDQPIKCSYKKFPSRPKINK